MVVGMVDGFGGNTLATGTMLGTKQTVVTGTTRSGFKGCCGNCGAAAVLIEVVKGDFPT